MRLQDIEIQRLHLPPTNTRTVRLLRKAIYTSSLFVWTGKFRFGPWLVGDALVEQRVWMAHGQNTTYVSYNVARAGDVVELDLTPLCTYRDYHSQTRGERNFFVSHVEHGIKIDAHWARPVSNSC